MLSFQDFVSGIDENQQSQLTGTQQETQPSDIQRCLCYTWRGQPCWGGNIFSASHRGFSGVASRGSYNKLGSWTSSAVIS